MNDNGINTRIYGLDILRAVAIMYVMFSHGYEYSGHIIGLNYYRYLLLDGVGLFFVLSGFLIGGILIKTAREKVLTFRELLRFWIRRWFRTLPNYYLVLGILLVCYFKVHQQLPPQWLQYITFTQNFASPHPLFFGEAWSLPVEEWFYLLVPAGLFLVLFFTKGRRKHILSWILFVLLATTLIRVVRVSQHDYFADGSFLTAIGKEVITRMDALMYGMLGAWLSIYKPEQWYKYRGALFAAGLVLLFGSNFIQTDIFYGYFYYSIGALGTLCLLPMLSNIRKGKGILYRSFTFISTISYSMYLTNHMIVQRGIMPILLKKMSFDAPDGMLYNAIVLVLFWGLTIVISYALYRFWERPMMRLRDRFNSKTTI